MTYEMPFRKWGQDGFSLEAVTMPDLDPDTSWLGEYSDKPWQNGRDGILVRPVRARSGYLYRKQTYFYPQPGCEEYADQDEERLRAYYLEHWSLETVAVHASKAGIRLGSDYLGNVESDSDYDLIIRDHGMVGEAIERAKETLAKLCTPVES